MALETLYSTEYPNNARIVSGSVVIKKDDVSLYCDTSVGPVNIFLLQIPSGNWSTEYTVYIKDTANNASANNITITAPSGFFIDNATTYTINTNNGCIEIVIGSDIDYLVLNGASGLTPLTQLLIARTAFVAKNGNDATGIIERLDKPFLTIAAARAAVIAAESAFYTNATAGKHNSVVSANDRILIKVFTGYYQEQIILANFVDFDLSDAVIAGANGVGITDNDVQCDSIIYGSSQIEAAVFTENAATNFRIDADTINGQTGFCIFVFAGKVIANVKTMMNSTLVNAGGTVASGGTLIINNSRIINSGGDVCADGGSSILILNNCTLLPTGSNCIRNVVFVYGGCQSNKPAKALSIQRVGTITVDPNVV